MGPLPGLYSFLDAGNQTRDSASSARCFTNELHKEEGGGECRPCKICRPVNPSPSLLTKLGKWEHEIKTSFLGTIYNGYDALASRLVFHNIDAQLGTNFFSSCTYLAFSFLIAKKSAIER